MANSNLEAKLAADLGAASSRPDSPPIRIIPFGLSLGIVLSLTFALCVLYDLWVPEQGMREIWLRMLPGFTWLTWPSFFLGLVETFSYGWAVAIVFAPLYNFFSSIHRG